jgi:hypothetical protein
MGEYAKLIGTGESVKIGTCEDMLYLRYDQRHRIWPQHGNVDPTNRQQQEVIRFRFPWPDEDGTPPGSFDDPFRRLAVHVPAPKGVEHGIVQFVASREGYNVCLPCPEGPDAASHGLRVNRNGFAGPAFLVQQAIRGGRLVAICECVCGRRYNLPTIIDAESVCADILAQAESALRRKDETRATYLVEVARRVREGYNAAAVAENGGE